MVQRSPLAARSNPATYLRSNRLRAVVYQLALGSSIGFSTAFTNKYNFLQSIGNITFNGIINSNNPFKSLLDGYITTTPEVAKRYLRRFLGTLSPQNGIVQRVIKFPTRLLRTIHSSSHINKNIELSPRATDLISLNGIISSNKHLIRSITSILASSSDAIIKKSLKGFVRILYSNGIFQSSTGLAINFLGNIGLSPTTDKIIKLSSFISSISLNVLINRSSFLNNLGSSISYNAITDNKILSSLFSILNITKVRPLNKINKTLPITLLNLSSSITTLLGLYLIGILQESGSLITKANKFLSTLSGNLRFSVNISNKVKSLLLGSISNLTGMFSTAERLAVMLIGTISNFGNNRLGIKNTTRNLNNNIFNITGEITDKFSSSHLASTIQTITSQITNKMRKSFLGNSIGVQRQSLQYSNVLNFFGEILLYGTLIKKIRLNFPSKSLGINSILQYSLALVRTLFRNISSSNLQGSLSDTRINKIVDSIINSSAILIHKSKIVFPSSSISTIGSISQRNIIKFILRTLNISGTIQSLSGYAITLIRNIPSNNLRGTISAKRINTAVDSTLSYLSEVIQKSKIIFPNNFVSTGGNLRRYISKLATGILNFTSTVVSRRTLSRILFTAGIRPTGIIVKKISKTSDLIASLEIAESFLEVGRHLFIIATMGLTKTTFINKFKMDSIRKSINFSKNIEKFNSKLLFRTHSISGIVNITVLIKVLFGIINLAGISGSLREHIINRTIALAGIIRKKYSLPEFLSSMTLSSPGVFIHSIRGPGIAVVSFVIDKITEINKSSIRSRAKINKSSIRSKTKIKSSIIEGDS